MSHPNGAWEQLKPYLQAFRTHYRLWVIPTAALTLLAFVYSCTMSRAWRADQALLVRAEAIGNQVQQGQFDTIDRMKVFQETVLEVARNRTVVAAVLRRMGPPDGYSADVPWPTEPAIDSLQSRISASAPKGAEFGRTEMLFLSVTASSREKAIALTKILCDEVDKHLGQLRDAKAQSIMHELENKWQLAQQELNDATSRLEVVEREVGSDLGELRVLSEMGSGESNLRTGLNQVTAELRHAENNRESLLQLRELLEASGENSDKLLATPSRLLEAQPAIRRLKEGLVDAQLRCAALRGKLSEEHPSVISARRTEAAIRRDLNAEVSIALQAVEADLQANTAQALRLEKQKRDLQLRLDRLASLRARYSNLVADVRRRTEIVDSAKRELSVAQASSIASSSTSLLMRFHDPVAGDRPVGPGRKSIVAAGFGGGLTLGAGLVFLFMPVGPNGTGRRWNDYLNLGRRATDRYFGRRAADRVPLESTVPSQPAQPAAKPGGRRASDVTLPATTSPAGRRGTDLMTGVKPTNLGESLSPASTSVGSSPLASGPVGRRREDRFPPLN